MNFLFLYRIYPNYGGVEVVTTVLANRFVQDGHNVTIVSFEQPHMELLKDLNSTIILEKLAYPVISRQNIKKLHDIITVRNIDVIINQWGLPFFTTRLCVRAIKGTKCRLISVLHGSPNTSKVIIKSQEKIRLEKNPILKIIYKLELRVKEEIVKRSIQYNCDNNAKYILLSQKFIDPLVKYARLKKIDNIISISNPITIPIDLQNFNLNNKKKQVLYVGRIDYYNKRVNRIIEAWESIYRTYPDWELVLVGDGDYKNCLIDYVNEHSIDRVVFKEFQVEPPIKYYKDASIFMLTSDLEGFGLVLIEAMSYGVVPVVYGSYEAVYDIIDKGRSGFITHKPYSKEETVKYLSFLIENDEKRNEMAKQSMIDAKKFSLDNITLQWYKTIDEVVL